jgi:outer membrane receptor protein involved in Fe transport
LSGEHTFQRFNPAVGVTWELGNATTFYAGYSEANRTPSPVELTCADEDDPCRLPNAFLADPPLEQVVASTVETGVRGRWDGGTWHAGVFRTLNQDDISFISAGALTNQGFFSNVGRTRRDGVELDLDGTAQNGITWFANYTYLRATFRDDFFVPSANNPAAVDGQIFVRSGDRLPLIPSQVFKAGVRVPVGPKFVLGGDFLASSSFYLRGDEGNDTAQVGGYGVLNLRADYQLSGTLRLFLNLDNVLDREYETFGTFGEADEVLGDEFDDTRFLSPAAPRAAWLGVNLKF